MTTQQILVIDDDPGMGRSVCDLLGHYGYEPDYVSEGKVGLSKLTENDFDILILDLNIPDMSGIEVLTHLKNLNKKVKTIVLSGESEIKVVTPVLRLGAYDYLSKPYEPEQLLGAVRNALNGLKLERDNEQLHDEREVTRLRHEFLLNASPDLIYLLDSQGQFTFVNNQLKEIFHHSADQLIGKTWKDLLDSDTALSLNHYFNERRTGERSTKAFEFEYFKPETRKRYLIELSAMGVYTTADVAEQKFEGTYGILRDITQARDLAEQEQRAKSDKAAIEAQLQESSKMEAIGRLAGGIAHDFNNILATIIGYTELSMPSARPLKPEALGKYLTEVLDASKQARDLISQMLNFSRTSRWNARRLNVMENLSQVSSMLRAAIPGNIVLETDYAEDLPDIFMDALQLQQLVVNLIINATDAIEGSGRITLNVQHQDLSGDCTSCGEHYSGNYISLSVSDSGARIPQELHKRIFGSLVSSVEPGRGSGFGLWQVHNIVHEYGGHIRVKSLAEQGAQFTLLLPQMSDSMQSAHKHSDITNQAGGAGTILVVDEEVSLSKLIGELLSNSGYEVVILNSSTEAMTFIKQNHKQLSLIITDQDMPQISGLQLTEQTKAIAADLPVIVMSSITSNDARSKLSKHNVDGILSKPFNVDDLQEKVRSLTRYKHS